MVKNPPAMRETWIRSLGWEDPLEKGKATHTSILAWRIPMDRGAWRVTVHGVEESDTTKQLSTAEALYNSPNPLLSVNIVIGFLQWLSRKESACSAEAAGDLGSIPGSGRSPGGGNGWRRKWQSPPIIFPGKFHEQKSLTDYSPWGHREWDTTEQPRAPHTQTLSWPLYLLEIHLKYTIDTINIMWFFFLPCEYDGLSSMNFQILIKPYFTGINSICLQYTHTHTHVYKSWIRAQIANIHWIIKKAREFQKNISFCFIDYAKASDCVDHNKLWKNFKEMGIPDHLTCLLRNL